MTRRDIIAGFLSAGAVGPLSGCSWFWPSSTIRYRLTVEVDTPVGFRTGSSVIEVKTVKGPRMGDSSGIRYDIRGEAVVVDLPGGPLFVLLSDRRSLSPDYPAYLMFEGLTNGLVMPPLSRVYGPHEWEAYQAEARQVKPTIILRSDDYPIFVRFRDVRDPKSVEAVSPKNLAATFGTGVKLRRLTLNITNDPVTAIIGYRLKWLSTHNGSLDYAEYRHPQQPEKDLTPTSFKQGTG